jgi:hypothetical protein
VATYYLNNASGYSGSDSNNGTSDTTPKLTGAGIIALGLAAGDTVHVAGGTCYRELITLATSGSSGNEINWVCDEYGVIWPRLKGKAQITASDNTTSTARARALDMGGRTYQNFKGFIFSYGTTNAVGSSSSNAGNSVFEECWIISSVVAGGSTGPLGVNIANTTFRRCRFDSLVFGKVTAQSNMIGLVFEDCWFGAGINGFDASWITTQSAIRRCTFESVSAVLIRNRVASTTVGLELLLDGIFSAGTFVEQVEAAASNSILETGPVHSVGGITRTNTTTAHANTKSGSILPDLVDWGNPMRMRTYTDDSTGNNASTATDYRRRPRLTSGPVYVGALQRDKVTLGSV